MKRNELPIPTFYDSKNAAAWSYRPDPAVLLSTSEQWAKQYGLKPQASDRARLHLLLIDVQKDFCLPEGSLYVGGRSGKGAIEDSDRLARFIYRNLDKINEITTTLDTHFAYQIFSPTFWLTKDGHHPNPFRFVTSDEVAAGDLRPNPRVAALYTAGNYSWLLSYVQHYCKELEKSGKYQLYLWPYHCLLGSDGHALVPVIHEARLFHAFVRGSQTSSEVKGGSPFTENYSVLSPEVLVTHDGRSVGQRNTEFIKKLLESDAVVIAGQAASHCVKSSIDDLLQQILTHDAKLASKVYIMTDCMSSVAVPDGKGGFVADFTDEAKKAFDRFANAGMHLVRSTDPIESWMTIN
ncbi:MAG TPA: nicotinamidase [Thermoanaerobaculia bacterium]